MKTRLILLVSKPVRNDCGEDSGDDCGDDCGNDCGDDCGDYCVASANLT